MMLTVELISQAIKRRAGLFEPSSLETLQAFRIFDGKADGDARFFMDRYGPFVLIHYLPLDKDVLIPTFSAEVLSHLQNQSKTQTVYLRVHAKGTRVPHSAQLLAGDAIESTVVQEHQLKFLVKPQAQFNAGLFLDTRDLRQNLFSLCAGMKVLNTFCFTGTLGIAAFAGGAREVVQVDVAKSALSWAQENLGINAVQNPGIRGHDNQMRFIPEDAVEFIDRQAKRIQSGLEAYDLVILDPPSFGQSKKKAFSFKKDIHELVNKTMGLFGKRAHIILTTNSRSFTEKDMLSIIETAARDFNFVLRSKNSVLPPAVDFTSTGADSISLRGVFCELLKR